MLTNKTLFIYDLRVTAFITDKLSNLIVDDCLIGVQIIATLMCLTMTFRADKYLKAFVYYFSGDFSKVTKTYIAV